MPASIGVNLRVTGHCRQGGRIYMEDFFSVAYQQTEDEKDLEYAFFGIYDGHGGAEAAAFAKEHLMETIIKHKNFWSDNDEDVLRAIKDGYIATHYAMWKEQEKWPKTASGLPSTAGTTASVAFIRRGKIYIGHVGDSGIILGYQEPGCSEWKAKPLTKDHKPENEEEIKRIESCGGRVVRKSGVPRVVWNRPRIGHQGPVRRSTPIDKIPFLAVARSLGDLWSYNSQINQFVVSPEPDCSVLQIDTNIHRCLVFGTDGLYNMLSPMVAVHIVQQAERHNEHAALSDATYKTWLNPSKLLVERALDRWHASRMRADNTSVVTLMLDPPGPPRAQVLKDRKKNLPESGLKIMTRYDGNNSQEKNCSRSVQTSENPETSVLENALSAPSTILEALTRNVSNTSEDTNKNEYVTETPSISFNDVSTNFPLKERNFLPKPRDSTSFDPREPQRQNLDSNKENSQKAEDTIQINEISSSNIEENNTEDENSEENVTKTVKPTLRSAKKLKSGSPNLQLSEANEKRGVKRRLEGEKNLLTTRKSLRIDRNQKRTSGVEDREKKIAPCTLAEEKLKKLAEEAEKLKKRLLENNNNTPQKLSLTQKILKSKKLNLKKKHKVKQPITKKKIQMVLDTVLQKSRKKLESISEKKSLEEKKPEKKPVKVVTSSKVCHFQRHSKRNQSLRQRNAENFQKKTKEVVNKSSKPKIVQDPKKGTLAKQKLQENIKVRTSDRLSDNMRRRSAKENIEQNAKNSSSSLKKIVSKQPVRPNTLKKRLQQKTATLRRSVMRK